MRNKDYISSVIYKAALEEELEWRKEKENRNTVHLIDNMLKEIRALGYSYKYFTDLTNRANNDIEVFRIIENYIPKFNDAWIISNLISIIGVKGSNSSVASIVLECYARLTDDEKRMHAGFYDNALCRIGDRHFISDYLELLENPEDAVKLPLTMIMLGKWQIKEAKKYFIEYLNATILYLNTSVSDLIFTSMDALSYYDDSDGTIKMLIENKLNSSDKNVVSAAKKALKRMKKRENQNNLGA